MRLHLDLDSFARSSGHDGGIAFFLRRTASWSSAAGAHRRPSATPAVYRFRQFLSDLCDCARHGVLHRAPYSALPLRDHGRPAHPSPGVRDPDPAVWWAMAGCASSAMAAILRLSLASGLMSLLYGLGAALTLDEFALWLNLKDVYFVREGRSSIRRHDFVRIAARDQHAGVRLCSRLWPGARPGQMARAHLDLTEH